MDELAGQHLSSYRAILSVAVPAAVFRVSGVLSATLQTSLVSHHGGRDVLAAFAAVGVTVKTALLLFAFMADGVAAKVGRSAAHETRGALVARVRLYLASCLVLGAATAVLLLAARELILHPFHLSAEVHGLATAYWAPLSSLLPLALLSMGLSGVLQGLRRVGLSAALEAATSAAEVAGAFVVLTHPRMGPGAARLRALALVKWAAAAAYAAVGSALVAASLAKHAQQGAAAAAGEPASEQAGAETGQRRSAGSTGSHLTVMGRPSLSAPLLSHAPTPATSMRRGPGCQAQGSGAALKLLAELALDGANVMVRSVLVQGSMWLVAVAAARLGTAALGAHQILTQLWMLPTHFSGGFAVAGIVLGSRLALGQAEAAGAGAYVGRSTRRSQRRLSARLLLFATSLGAAVGCGLAAGQAAALSLFRPAPDVAAALQGPAWAVLCAMQPLTSALFTLTGLIYGAHYFAFMRSVLLLGFLGLFCPALLWVVRRRAAEQAAAGTGGALLGAGCAARGLGEVWLAKLVFYVWQAAAEGAGVAHAVGCWGGRGQHGAPAPTV